METLWSTALWRQFGAAIDMLENAVVACPEALWMERLWPDPPPPEFPPQFAEFWYVTFHTLIWLDLYLSGVPETEEQARRPVEYPWSEGQPVSFLELQLYTMRHVQEHAAHLSLFLGQHGVSGAELDWVPRVSGGDLTN
jgi:hypothetical protein